MDILSKACWLAVSGHRGGDCLGHLVDTCHQSTDCDLPRVAQAVFEPASGSVGAVSQLILGHPPKVVFACFTITTNIGLMCVPLASRFRVSALIALGFLYNFVYLFLAVWGLPCLEGSSVVSAGGGYSSCGA